MLPQLIMSPYTILAVNSAMRPKLNNLMQQAHINAVRASINNSEPADNAAANRRWDFLNRFSLDEMKKRYRAAVEAHMNAAYRGKQGQVAYEPPDKWVTKYLKSVREKKQASNAQQYKQTNKERKNYANTKS